MNEGLGELKCRRHFVLVIPHLIFSDADVGHAEVDVRECLPWVRCGEEADVRGLLSQDDLACVGDDLLAPGIVVVEFDLADREAVQVVQQHQYDFRCIGTAASGDDDG